MSDDDRIDAQLREWGEQQRRAAERVDDGTEPTAPYPRRRVGLLAVAAAAAVLLIAGGALALRDSTGTPSAKSAAPSTGAPAPTSQAPTSSSPKPPPPGTQQVAFHSLAVTVPATWKIDDEYCGNPRSDTVLLPDHAVEACTGGLGPGTTWVEFRSSGQFYWPVEHAHTRHILVSGHPAIETSGRARGTAVVFVDVPAVRASAAVYSPSPARARRIAGTLAAVDVDSHGCVTQAPYEPLPATPQPARPAAHGSLIPGNPVSMAVCGYDSSGLGGSGEIPGSELGKDLALLRSLPRGYSINPHRPHPSQCTNVEDPATSLDRTDAGWYAVLVKYRDGPILVLHARIGRCGYLGITNGAVSAQRSFDLARLLFLPSHVSFGFPEHVVPVAR